MSNNQQPFSPPLTAEERDAWDLVYMGCCVQNTVESSAKHADEAIHERRRRFGVPGPTAQDLCAQELFRKVCDKSEIDTLRAEVERLTKERDEVRDQYRDVVTKLEQCSDSLGPINRELASMRARAEKAEANATSLRQSLHASEALRDALKTEIKRLTKDVQVRENVYRIRCEQVDALVSRAEKAEAELAAARPVLEAVVRWFSERAWTVKDADTLRDYAMSQRAARAAKSPDATNDTNGGM